MTPIAFIIYMLAVAFGLGALVGFAIAWTPRRKRTLDHVGEDRQDWRLSQPKWDADNVVIFKGWKS